MLEILILPAGIWDTGQIMVGYYKAFSAEPLMLAWLGITDFTSRYLRYWPDYNSFYKALRRNLDSMLRQDL